MGPPRRRHFPEPPPRKESQELEQDLQKVRGEKEQRSFWGRVSETLQEEMMLTTHRHPARSASSNRSRQVTGPALRTGSVWKGGTT